MAKLSDADTKPPGTGSDAGRLASYLQPSTVVGIRPMEHLAQVSADRYIATARGDAVG